MKSSRVCCIADNREVYCFSLLGLTPAYSLNLDLGQRCSRAKLLYLFELDWRRIPSRTNLSAQLLSGCEILLGNLTGVVAIHDLKLDHLRRAQFALSLLLVGEGIELLSGDAVWAG